jgi:DNA modification methylase
MPYGKVVLADSRSLREIDDGSVHLCVTSPPYWSIKDYGIDGQIGKGSDLHDYLRDLYMVWKECMRVLVTGRRLVVNIGDQFTRSRDFGRYKVVPLHAEVISQCERIGLDFMGSIIWQKRTTVNTTGGATIMGSYPYPPNGIVEIDHENIMIFKKPGKAPTYEGDKEGSVIPKDDWKELFRGHWSFGGARQVGHEAVFPLELPTRIIRMFTFRDETVLDPFLGSGTTMRAALDLGRSAIGYEINRTYLPLIKDKVGPLRFLDGAISLFERPGGVKLVHDPDYTPSIQNMDPGKVIQDSVDLFKVESILPDLTLRTSDGCIHTLGGISIKDPDAVRIYLEGRVRGRDVIIRSMEGREGLSLIYLKNRIFINRHLVETGLAEDAGLPTGRRSRR